MIRLVAAVAAVPLTLSACGSGSESSDEAPTPAGDDVEVVDTAAGLMLVSPTDAAATIDGAGDGLVILDVRTEEEFVEARIDGATMIDFYRADFRDALAELDPDAAYVLYCRSGARSARAKGFLESQGFTAVHDLGSIANA